MITTDNRSDNELAAAAESDALDRIAAALNRPDPNGWDVGIMEEFAEILTGTGRHIDDDVTNADDQ